QTAVMAEATGTMPELVQPRDVRPVEVLRPFIELLALRHLLIAETQLLPHVDQRGDRSGIRTSRTPSILGFGGSAQPEEQQHESENMATKHGPSCWSSTYASNHYGGHVLKYTCRRGDVGAQLRRELVDADGPARIS